MPVTQHWINDETMDRMIARGTGGMGAGKWPTRQAIAAAIWIV